MNLVVKVKKCINKDDSSSEEEPHLYQIISQFQEINVLTNDSLVEILRIVRDPDLRTKILDQIGNKDSTHEQGESVLQPSEPYTIAEVQRVLKQKQVGNYPTTIQDLAIEITNLKNELKGLKTHNRNLEDKVSKLEDRKSVV